MNKDVYKKILDAREKKNKNLIHASFEMETSTHFPMLIKLVQMTTGPIIEVGSGLFSTPLLHWLCFENKRKLLTLEQHQHYMDFAQKFRSENHEVLLVKHLERYDWKGHASVVFIDHSPKKPRTRGDDALLFKGKADYIILHDAGPHAKTKYGYQQLYDKFNYVFNWSGAIPNTTVLCDSKELFKKLWQKT